jgi:hypothetical protein
LTIDATEGGVRDIGCRTELAYAGGMKRIIQTGTAVIALTLLPSIAIAELRHVQINVIGLT